MIKKLEWHESEGMYRTEDGDATRWWSRPLGYAYPEIVIEADPCQGQWNSAKYSVVSDLFGKVAGYKWREGADTVEDAKHKAQEYWEAGVRRHCLEESAQ